MCARRSLLKTLKGYFRHQVNPIESADDVPPLEPRGRNRRVDDDDRMEQIEMADGLPDRQLQPLADRVVDASLQRGEGAIDGFVQLVRSAYRRRDLRGRRRVGNQVD